MTRLVPGERRVRSVRVRGGHTKWRALRLDAGNFAWSSECMAKKARILDVVYNSSSNELVRTKTLVKGCVVAIDSTPYRNWYYRRYGVSLGQKSEVKLKKMMEVRYKTAAKGQSKIKSSKKADSAKKVEVKKSAERTDKKTDKKTKVTDKKGGKTKKTKRGHVSQSKLRRWAKRAPTRGQVDKNIAAQFENGLGKLYAVIASRPGQVGRADGYILEGTELEFYLKKMDKKKKKTHA
jgi:small subunit ribosomal protein S8e